MRLKVDRENDALDFRLDESARCFRANPLQESKKPSQNRDGFLIGKASSP